MTMRSRSRPRREPPETDEVAEDPERLREYLRLESKDQQRQIRELEAAIPGDVNDHVRVRSKGAGVKILTRAPKRMQEVPDAYGIMAQTGPGVLWYVGSLVKNGNVEFYTDAPAGVEFLVRLYRVGPVRGRFDEPPPVEDQQPVAPDSIQTAAKSNVPKKKKWTE